MYYIAIVKHFRQISILNAIHHIHVNAAEHTYKHTK